MWPPTFARGEPGARPAFDAAACDQDRRAISCNHDHERASGVRNPRGAKDAPFAGEREALFTLGDGVAGSASSNVHAHRVEDPSVQEDRDRRGRRGGIVHERSEQQYPFTPLRGAAQRAHGCFDGEYRGAGLIPTGSGARGTHEVENMAVLPTARGVNGQWSASVPRSDPLPRNAFRS